MGNLITVVMAGGRGERLWPKSNSEIPKQFAKIISDKTMLEETIQRCQILSPPKKIYISTLKKNFSLLKKIIPRFPISNIITEPMIRDTAAAILLATMSIPAQDNDVLIFIPADHYMKHLDKFKHDVITAFRNTQKTKKVTLIGITPTFASTEYGYLELKGISLTQNLKTKTKQNKVLPIKNFIEKPNLQKAKNYFKSGKYLWNSGIFMFNRRYLLELFQHHTPQLYSQISKYLDLLKNKKTTQATNLFKKITKISFDYAIAEKITQVDCVRSTFFWDDVGSWESLFRIKPTDHQGNIVIPKEKCYLKESENNLCLIEDDSFVVLNGIKGSIIISKDNKIYIADRKNASKVKVILKELEHEKKYKRNKKL